MILLKIGNFYCQKLIFLAECLKSKPEFKVMLIFRILETA